jgi:hypothetical protein
VVARPSRNPDSDALAPSVYDDDRLQAAAAAEAAHAERVQVPPPPTACRLAPPPDAARRLLPPLRLRRNGDAWPLPCTHRPSRRLPLPLPPRKNQSVFLACLGRGLMQRRGEAEKLRSRKRKGFLVGCLGGNKARLLATLLYVSHVTRHTAA